MSFAPADWSTVYESSRPSPPALVFRRGAALARTHCLARARPGERWIDVGAGTGHLAASLAEAGLRVSAVDHDPEMVEAARRRFGDRLEVIPGDAESLPFPDECVDGVVSTALFGLLPDQTAFLSEVARVLRPGGTAVLTVTHRSGRFQRLADLGPYAASARRFSRAEVLEALDEAGLQLERADYFNFFVARERAAWPSRRVALALERGIQRPAGPVLARNLIAVAAK